MLGIGNYTQHVHAFHCKTFIDFRFIVGATPGDKCKVAADISLIVDASQSVELGGRIAGISGYFQKVVKEGLKTIVQSFEVSPKDARFSLMLFGDAEPMVCSIILVF